VGGALMFGHEFVRHAYLAGTFVALACGVIGWFAVLRAEVFAADALSHVAFVGAVAAAVIGVDKRVGLFALTLVAAAGMATLGRRGQADDVVIGISFAWILGLGILLISLLSTGAQSGQGTTTINTLFGSIYGLDAGASWLAAVIGGVVVAIVVLAVRPLLLCTLDPALAALRGIPVGLVGVAFLGLLAVVTAESAQAVGALLLLGLIAAPAGAAHQLTARPYLGIALSGLLAVLATWAGLALAYVVAALPPSTAIIAFAAAAYAGAAILARLRNARWRPPAGAVPPRV
jgi:zinc/manganese transport system permease protein